MADSLQKQVDKLKRRIETIRMELEEENFEMKQKTYDALEEIQSLRELILSVCDSVSLCREAIVAINQGKILKFKAAEKENPAAASEPGSSEKQTKQTTEG